MQYLERPRIKLDNLIFIRNIDEYFAPAICHCSFRLTVKRNRANNATSPGVDNGHIASCAIHDEDAFRDVVVNKRVRIFSGLYAADLLQGLQVDDGGGVPLSVRRKSAAKVRREYHAVSVRQTSNLADDGASVNINHIDVIVPADVQMARVAVHGDVVPAFSPTDRNSFQ